MTNSWSDAQRVARELIERLEAEIAAYERLAANVKMTTQQLRVVQAKIEQIEALLDKAREIAFDQ